MVGVFLRSGGLGLRGGNFFFGGGSGGVRGCCCCGTWKRGYAVARVETFFGLHTGKDVIAEGGECGQ